MRKILIVDDEPDIVDSLKTLIEIDGGFEVFTAPNGLEGFEEFKSKKPSLVITDVRMPVKDGVWLLEEIRKMDQTTPVIFLSGFSTVQNQDGTDQPFQAYIKKPDDIPRISEIIKEYT